MKLTLKSIGLVFIFSLAALAQTEKGIELYKQGDSANAVKVLKQATKQNAADSVAFHYLGLALMRGNKIKDAEKAFENSIKINATFADAHLGLAYVYLLRGKLKDADSSARKYILLNGRSAEPYYIIGTIRLRSGDAEEALENAEKAIRINPNLAGAYLLKAHSVMNLSSAGRDYKSISAKYGNSANSIGKFITLSKNLLNVGFWRGQQEALKFFADYYLQKEKEATENAGQTTVTPLKILTKPRAGYTDQARQAGVSGYIRLLVAFSENGTVSHVIALNSLGYGLDEQAIKAAKKIKFEPETRDGKNVTSAKVVEYNFTLY